ncbi:hypothetical protein N7475_001736 [Penicillium sp. IBT 31633x]|nr:hypothetical protein N7475_001736 [Penicillium sp. IBT 31633x]
MAKSVRASVSKRNRANLRKKVFGPVVDARTERLAAKLQELASQPRPDPPQKLNKNLAEDEADETAKAPTGDEEMDIDTVTSSKKKPARVQKRNQKPRNSIVFKKRPSSNKKGPKRK